MSYTKVENYVSNSKYSIKCPYTMTPIGICIHNTANNATAKNEVAYMISNSNQTSFHVAVDDKYVVKGIPFNRNAWHAGDGGSGTGNRKYLSIEICYETGSLELFKKAEANAAKYCAELCKKYGWTTRNIKRHYDFSGKQCPKRSMALGWQRFLNMVDDELAKLKKTNTTSTTSSNTSFKIKVVNVPKGDYLFARVKPDINAKVADRVPNGTILTIVDSVKSNDITWFKTKSELYVSSKYCKRI